MSYVADFPYSKLDLLWGRPLWDLAKEGAPTHTATSYKEFGAIIPCLLILFTFRKVAKIFWSRLFVLLVNMNKPDFKKTDPKGYNTKHNKFCSQMSKVIIHGVAAVWAWLACRNEKWWFPNTVYIIDNLYEVTIPNDPMTFSHKLYYMILAAYHLESLLTHPFEEARDDDLQMWIHHFVTIAVISGSYNLGFTYWGTLVFFVHDASDVPVAIAKLFNYSKFSAGVVGFAFLFLISGWIYFRNYVFSRHIIGVIYYATYKFYYTKETWVFLCGVFFGSLLSILEILHINWLWIIIHVALNIIKGKKEIDASEHWNQEDEEDKETPAGVKKTSQAELHDDSTIRKRK